MSVQFPNKQDLRFELTDEGRQRMIAVGWLEDTGNMTPLGVTAMNRAYSYALTTNVEALPDTFEIAFATPENSLQQDLFLLAKEHYGNGVGRLQAAAAICAFHTLVPLKYWRHDITVNWLLKNFVETDLILQERKSLSRFLMEAGSFPKDKLSYHAALVMELLHQVYLIAPYDDSGKYILPFPMPKKDILLVEMLECMAKKDSD